MITVLSPPSSLIPSSTLIIMHVYSIKTVLTMCDIPSDDPRPLPSPRDRCSLVYVGLMLCGAGFLLPYNNFISAVDFYQGRYPNSTIIFDISLIYILTAFISVLMNNLLVEVCVILSSLYLSEKGFEVTHNIMYSINNNNNNYPSKMLVLKQWI